MSVEMPDRTKVPVVRQIEARGVPSVAREVLANGVELVILDSGVQPVNRLAVCWNAGSVDIDDLAAYNLMKDLLKEGTVSRSGEEISDLFETCGAWVTVETGQHATLLTAYMLNHTADEVMDAVADIIAHASFPEEALLPLREKKSSAAALARKKVKTVALMNSTAITFGENHPKNRFVDPEDYRSVTRERVVSVYDRLLRGGTPKVYISGQIDSALLEKVRHTIGAIDFGRGGVLSRVSAAGFSASGDSRHTSVADSMQTALRITIPAIPVGHPDYMLLKIAVFALGGYFGSRLMSNIREEKGYTYGISAGLGLCKEGSFVSIQCETDNRYAEDVKREIKREIERLASEPMGDDELSVVKNTLMAQIANMFDSPFTIMDYWITVDAYGDVVNDIEERMRLLGTVTAEQIAATANRYLLDVPWLVASAGGEVSPSGPV